MWVNDVVWWVGTFVVSFLLLYGVGMLGHVLFAPKAEPVLSAGEMPTLVPIPIPTNHHSVPMKILVWLYESRCWRLAEHWSFQLTADTVIVIPKNFVFDGASIPRPLWSVLTPIGLLLIPGLIHDFGYKYQQLWTRTPEGEVVPYMRGADKQDWDRLFLKVGINVNGFALVNVIAWLAVRLVGGWSWRKHRRARLEAPVPVL